MEQVFVILLQKPLMDYQLLCLSYGPITNGSWRDPSMQKTLCIVQMVVVTKPAGELGVHRAPKGYFNFIYHPDYLLYDLTLSYLLKTLYNYISTHCNIVSKLPCNFLHLLVRLLIFYYLHVEGLSHSGIPKRMLCGLSWSETSLIL